MRKRNKWYKIEIDDSDYPVAYRLREVMTGIVVAYELDRLKVHKFAEHLEKGFGFEGNSPQFMFPKYRRLIPENKTTFGVEE